jgi:hypothetical protein
MTFAEALCWSFLTLSVGISIAYTRTVDTRLDNVQHVVTRHDAQIRSMQFGCRQRQIARLSGGAR